MPKTQDLKDIIHQRMLALMRHAVEKGKALDAKDWCKQIDINYRNFNQKGPARQGYTDDQKLAAVKLVGSNMDWLFGMEERMIIKPAKLMNLEDHLQEALRLSRSKNDKMKTIK